MIIKWIYKELSIRKAGLHLYAIIYSQLKFNK